MRKMIALVDARIGETREITVTRIIRVETGDERKCWFDIALTTEMTAHVRTAGAPDHEPWRPFALVPFGAHIEIVDVTLARDGSDGAPAVAPSPQAMMDRLAGEQRAAKLADFQRRQREEFESGKLEERERKTGKIHGECRYCGKRRPWKHDADGMVVMATPVACPATAAGGDVCRRARPGGEDPDEWEQPKLAIDDAPPASVDDGLHGGDGAGKPSGG